MRYVSWLIVCIAVLMIGACKIRIAVPEGGNVSTVSEAYYCGSRKTCEINVVDTFFDETFVVEPSKGYTFTNWKRRKGAICKGKKPNPCRLFTSFFDQFPVLMEVLESDKVFYLEPVFLPEGAHGVELPNYERTELPKVSPLGYEVDGEPRGISQWHAADVNGDGLEDLVLALNSGSFTKLTQPTQPLILVNDGLGSLADRTSFLIEGPIPKLHHTRGILVDDFNGDGRADIFFSNSGKEEIIDGEFPCEANVLLLSGADGRLHDASSSSLPPLADFSHGSTAADVDSDGDIDIWVNNLGCRNGPPSYLLENDGTGSFSIVANIENFSNHGGFVGANGRLPDEFIAVNGAYWTLFVDADVDGDPDLFFQSNSEPFSLGLLLNDGSGSFSLKEDAIQLETPLLGSINDAEAVDVDHDGDQDLIILDLDGPTTSKFMIRILISNGDGTFSEETSSRLLADQPFTENFGLPILNITDLNGDGNPEILYSTSAFEFSGEFRFDFSSNASGIFTRIPLGLLPEELDGSDRFYPVDTGGNGISDLVTLTDSPNGWPELALVLYKAVEQDDSGGDEPR